MVYSMREATISGVYVSSGSAKTLVRKSVITNTFDSMLSQQYLCQKLPKLVNVYWSCCVQHECHFLRHSVYCATMMIRGVLQIRHRSPKHILCSHWTDLNQQCQITFSQNMADSNRVW